MTSTDCFQVSIVITEILTTTVYQHFLHFFFQATLNRGEVFTLKSNSDDVNWEVVSNDGVTKTFPGACFVIPPPDTEAIDKVDL